MTEVAIKKDHIERLADRVMAVGKAVAARGDGRTFTLRDIRDEFTDVNVQRLNDAIKTLKDRRSIVIVARSTYRVEEGFPEPRNISASVLSDGYWLFEVGSDYAVALTPEEARRAGLFFAGHTAKAIFAGEMRALEERMWGISRENEELRRQIAQLARQQQG